MPLVEGYGLSESTVALTVNPIDGPRKAGTVGRPLPGVEVAIMSDGGELLASGEDGEVVARGGTIMRGYLGKPDETAAALKSGWLHTGDVGHVDDDGYLVLVDRKKDLIIRGGENISPSGGRGGPHVARRGARGARLSPNQIRLWAKSQLHLSLSIRAQRWTFRSYLNTRGASWRNSKYPRRFGSSIPFRTTPSARFSKRRYASPFASHD